MHYETNAKLLGVPLVQIAIGAKQGAAGARGIARAWIAIGDLAFGVLFAVGGLAVGGISIGGLSIGGLAIAGLSIGIWSVGGLAVGVLAFGGAAIGLWAANGGFALAQEYAVGGQAIAAHANDAAARAYFEGSDFFRAVEAAARHSRWLLVLVVIAPLIAWAQRRGSGSRG